ncbi:PH domain-containing protein [Marinococcus halophilus]|uniref:Membrane protein n=1 Tax=Marinococcus halophilus TaxID=1371 RepID=A0A510Y3E2_MARHA|nr:PH domain-containing protein [Marinococcus halophilus]GEK57850.1 membrane protein [Marinococcus halophilus]
MNEWRRMHPAAIVTVFFRQLKDFLFPLIITFFAGSTASGPLPVNWIFLLLVLFIIISSIMKWVFFRYRLIERELQIHYGIFVKKERFIRSQRVQSVDITAGIIQRMFGLVRLNIETAGGGAEAEASVQAIRREEADMIQAALIQKSPLSAEEEKEDYSGEEAAPEPASPAFSWKVPMRAIFIAGLTSGRAGLIFAALAGLYSQVGNLLPDAWVEQSIGVLIDLSYWFIIGGLLGTALLSWLVSSAWTLVQHGNFEVNRTGNDLEITWGLLERKQITLQMHRITCIRFISNPARQALGMWAVYIDSAGGSTERGQNSIMLLPLIHQKQLHTFMKQIDDTALIPEKVNKLPKRAARRYMFRASVFWWLVFIPTAIWVPYGWTAAVVPFFFTWWGWMCYKGSGMKVEEKQLIVRERAWSAIYNFVPKRRIQYLENTQSFFQRKRKLYTISASVISSVTGRTVYLRDVDEQDEAAYFSWYQKACDSAAAKTQRKGF